MKKSLVMSLAAGLLMSASLHTLADVNLLDEQPLHGSSKPMAEHYKPDNEKLALDVSTKADKPGCHRYSNKKMSKYSHRAEFKAKTHDIHAKHKAITSKYMAMLPEQEQANMAAELKALKAEANQVFKDNKKMERKAKKEAHKAHADY